MCDTLNKIYIGLLYHEMANLWTLPKPTKQTCLHPSTTISFQMMQPFHIWLNISHLTFFIAHLHLKNFVTTIGLMFVHKNSTIVISKICQGRPSP